MRRGYASQILSATGSLSSKSCSLSAEIAYEFYSEYARSEDCPSVHIDGERIAVRWEVAATVEEKRWTYTSLLSPDVGEAR